MSKATDLSYPNQAYPIAELLPPILSYRQNSLKSFFTASDSSTSLLFALSLLIAVSFLRELLWLVFDEADDPFLCAEDARELIPNLDILFGLPAIYLLGEDNVEDILSTRVITSSG